MFPRAGQVARAGFPVRFWHSDFLRRPVSTGDVWEGEILGGFVELYIN